MHLFRPSSFKRCTLTADSVYSPANLISLFKSDRKADKEKIIEDLAFELELIRQVEINMDYILIPVSRFGGGRESKKNASLKK